MIHVESKFGETAGCECAECGGALVVVTVPCWLTHPVDDDQEYLELDEEVSAHYCRNCSKLTAIFFHRS